jgi:hypothetical protein
VNEIVPGGGHILAKTTMKSDRGPSLEFTVNGSNALEFRVFGTDDKTFEFRGVTLERDAGASSALVANAEFQVSPRIFVSSLGVAGPDVIRGDGSDRSGYLVYGPYAALPVGSYRVKMPIQARDQDVYHSDVTVGGKVICSGTSTARVAFTCDFQSTGRDAVEFRLAGRSTSAFAFYGARLIVQDPID